MITYHQGQFVFFRSLFRVHGSALHRAMIPSLFSSGVLLILEYTAYHPSLEAGDRWFKGLGFLLGAFTFLLTFKCSFSYNRYWEACTAIHQMQSKWLDVGMEIAAFHLQSERFSQIRPPAFGKHPHIDHVVRKRERLRPMTPMKLQEILREEEDDDYDDINLDESMGSFVSPKKKRGFKSFLRKRRSKGRNNVSSKNTAKSRSFFISNQNEDYSITDDRPLRSINNTNSQYDETQSLAAGVFKNSSSSSNKFGGGGGEESKRGRRPGLLSKIKSVPDLTGGMSKTKAGPSLFLQEASHLLSLLSAVAFATLRNDVESAESPLSNYMPGSPWPPVDPDAENAFIPYNFYKTSRLSVMFRYLCGTFRSPAQRTVYNACRPFCVLGGVSDAEVDVLQRARGPLAKTALCTMWLQEFISREFLNGAMGNVSPPIISRLFQYTSDGMIGYNQARKVRDEGLQNAHCYSYVIDHISLVASFVIKQVAYIPFPFPHSQLTTFFLASITVFMPVLMLSYIPEIIVAVVMNTLTVWVFFGKYNTVQKQRHS